MDLATILALLATTITILGFVYGFLRNFKNDINGHIDRLERRMDKFESRMISLEERIDARMISLEERIDARMISVDERMFWMATGKRLEDAVLEERMKKPKTNP